MYNSELDRNNLEYLELYMPLKVLQYHKLDLILRYNNKLFFKIEHIYYLIYINL